MGIWAGLSDPLTMRFRACMRLYHVRDTRIALVISIGDRWSRIASRSSYVPPTAAVAVLDIADTFLPGFGQGSFSRAVSRNTTREIHVSKYPSRCKPHPDMSVRSPPWPSAFDVDLSLTKTHHMPFQLANRIRRATTLPQACWPQGLHNMARPKSGPPSRCRQRSTNRAKTTSRKREQK